jgi:hypothetical protein
MLTFKRTYISSDTGPWSMNEYDVFEGDRHIDAATREQAMEDFKRQWLSRCVKRGPMSALGQKQTYAARQVMSALLPIATAKADFRTRSCPLYP